MKSYKSSSVSDSIEISQKIYTDTLAYFKSFFLKNIKIKLLVKSSGNLKEMDYIKTS